MSQSSQNLRSPLAGALRRRVGIGKQAEYRLADTLHVSRHTARGYLNGRTPTFEMFRVMARVYGDDFVRDVLREPHYAALRAIKSRRRWLGRAA